MMHRPLFHLIVYCLIPIWVSAFQLIAVAFASDPVAAPTEITSTGVIMAIDDVDLEEGELRLILQDSGFGKDTSLASRQASATVLIRQHLAMKSLLNLGGKSLLAIIDREMNRVSKQLEFSGSSLAKAASDRGVSLRAYQRHLAWQIAWREYLKSRVTQIALKSYFDHHQDQYGGRAYLVSQIFRNSEPSNNVENEAYVSPLEQIAKSVRQSSDVASEFALAAKQHSDAASANRGGDIGWVSLDGDLPSSVMSAVRKAKLGEVVGPIRSPLGDHLILVREHRDSEIKWESIVDQSQLRRDLTQSLFLDIVRQQNSAEVRYLDANLQPKF